LDGISMHHRLRRSLVHCSRNGNEVIDDTDLVVCGHDRDERDGIIEQVCHATCGDLAVSGWSNERKAYAAFRQVLCWFEHRLVFKSGDDRSVSPLSKPSLQGGRNSPVIGFSSAARENDLTGICA
jgi:hypothetical protein